VPDIEYAFLADAADARPGAKFSILGGGVDRIGGQTFPLNHPHIALVIGLTVTANELRREHEIRFALQDEQGRELTTGTASIVAHGDNDGRDTVLTFAVDLWNLSFPVPGDYSVRILVDGSERKRLPLAIAQLGVGPMVANTRLDA
jgi:hypothetical protein